MLPVAQQMEMSRRMDDIGNGLDLIAAGTQRRLAASRFDTSATGYARNITARLGAP